MTDFKEVWRRETEDWEIVEYEKQPNALSCNVNHRREDDISFHFGSLGVSREKLEAAQDELLDNLLAVFANTALANGWNVSISSFWSNLPYCIPTSEDYEEEEGEDVDHEFLAIVDEIHEFLTDVGLQHLP